MMIYSLLKSSARSRESAVALVIVLAFIVLLAGVTVAYLSRTTTDRQIAHGAFNDAKAEQLARSALDLIVGDFKQEIADGVPIDNSNIMPQRSPKVLPGTTPAIANLIRRSVRSDAISLPAVGSRASAVNSTSDISLNGRSVTLARWNSHYLVPKANTGDSSTDPITSGFDPPQYWAPDWVIVTRNGPVAFNAWSGALADASLTNAGYAIGRYAYAVYDEGGLLDANIVGLPSPFPAVTDLGRKGSTALADLTAMKLTAAGSTPNPITTSKIVAFRNYATLQSSGTFPSLSPVPNPESFLNYFLDKNRDFISVATTTYNDRTDQNFVTRRELIDLFGSGISASFNLLQFLGTFSRDKNIPTWKPTASSATVTQRFNLSDVSLIRPAPTSAVSGIIQTKFGLRWIDGTPGVANPLTPAVPGHWQYVGSSGATMLNRIPGFTMNPEFFQLLNYAMNGTSSDDAAHIRTTLSIGAAIIDQCDDDTAVDPTTGTTTTMIE